MDDVILPACKSEDLQLELARLKKENKHLTRRVSSMRNRIERINTVMEYGTVLNAAMSQEKLRNEIFLDLFLRNTPDIIFVFDKNGKFIYCADIFMKLADISSVNSVIGRSFGEVMGAYVSAADLAETENAIRYATRAQVGVSVSCAVAYGEKMTRAYDIHITPMLNNLSELTGVMFLFHDQTDHLQARAAEEASRAKSEFLTNVSHEIRTPLNAIMGISEIELQKELPYEMRRNFERIHTSGSILLSIINDLLDISKIEAGKLELVTAEYDLSLLLSDTINLSAMRAAGKAVRFGVKIGRGIPSRLCGDKIRVKQILNNLLSDIFKRADGGFVSIHVGGETIGDSVCLAFTITGTWRKFESGRMNQPLSAHVPMDSPDNLSMDETGFGLSICGKLVDMMGGVIFTDNTNDAVSTLMVRITQRAADPAPIPDDVIDDIENFRLSETRHIENRKLTRLHMPYGRVLVVDDVIMNIDVAKGLMLPYGLQVDCAENGSSAIEMVRSSRTEYGLIFMDHMMPEMDGVEALRNIRAVGTDYAMNVPVVALTANAIAGNAEIFMRNGFQEFLSKPIDILQLDRILNKYIHDKQSEETLRKAAENAPSPVREKQGGRLANALIRGVDIEAGLRQYEGDEELYLSLIASYVKSSSTLLESIRRVTKESLPDYAIIAHGLKGASRGICADAVGDTAEKLERAAKAGDYNLVVSCNDNFISETENLIGEFSEILSSLESARKTERGKKPAPSGELLMALRDACYSFNMKDMESAMRELKNYDYEKGGDLVLWLGEQIENLEYDKIRERIDEELEK
ncbi:hypothetical protein FACS1894216_17180 [Synergistales bacterium]|nr:hypothetical protein FACS1894216_17180 [Synergistales bacterium]